MAKSAGRPKARAKARATRARKEHTHEDDHVDGCDFEFQESDATPDAELPAARGGIAQAKKRRR